MRKKERSAGVVVFRMDETSAQRAYLLLDYGRYWDFPKGHVEIGEDDRTAAMRELHEETGISQIEWIDDFKREIRYFFRKQESLIDKTVVFFLARTAETKVTISHEHVTGGFFPFPDAIQRLRYPNARELLRRVEQKLSSILSQQYHKQ